ncbi:putative membrane protein [Brevundimonas sp. SORGH_AS 993]|nr:putative membrane protein [Brevundimonas sp. SORGH_AS_0993]
MLAAVQAPVIMMSQNRQAARDRLDANNDYQVNLKAEIEIMALLDKVEHLTARQEEQTALIRRLLDQKGG